MGEYRRKPMIRKPGIHPLLYKTVRVWFEGVDGFEDELYKVLYIGEMWKLSRLDSAGHPAGEEFWMPVAGFERVEEVLD